MQQLIDLKYCVRTKHSKDMPLKKPHKNCVFKGSYWAKKDPNGHRIPEECEFYPAHIEYCKVNNINLKENFGIRFRCVLECDKLYECTLSNLS